MSAQEIVTAVEQSKPVDASVLDDEILNELAQLSPIAYDRIRESRAKDLGIRVKTLDEEVERYRPKELKEESNRLELTDVEPFDEPVNAAELLAEMAGIFTRFCVLPEGAAVIASLWVLHTYLMDRFYVSPFLALQSPEPRCGKTTFLTLISAMSRKPLPVSNISPSAVFRAIEKWQPTLAIDECDTFMRENEELRGILNSGHLRTGAYVIRNVKTFNGDIEPTQFSTWAPKVLAGIKKLPATLQDRSIVMPLKRKAPHETAEKLRLDKLAFGNIPNRLRRWAIDHGHEVAASDPEMPSGLNDRAEDNYRTLMMVAAIAGWRDELVKAIAQIVPTDDDDDDNIALQLLQDIHSVFEKVQANDKGEKRIFSEMLLTKLFNIEESPWETYHRGKPITARSLARLLKPFGIRSKTIRIGNERSKGYEQNAFFDSWRRYIGIGLATPVNLSVTAGQINKNNELGVNLSVTNTPSVTDNKNGNLLNDKDCHAVTDKKGENKDHAHSFAIGDKGDAPEERF